MDSTAFASGGREEATVPPEAAGSGEIGKQLTLPNGRGRRAAPARVAQGFFSKRGYDGDSRRQAAAQGGGPAVPLLDGFREHLDLLVQLLHAGAESGASPGAPDCDAAEAASEALARSSAELTRTLFGGQPLAGPGGQSRQRKPQGSPRADAENSRHAVIDECGDGDDAITAPIGRDSKRVSFQSGGESAQGVQEDAAAKRVSFLSGGESDDDATAASAAPNLPQLAQQGVAANPTQPGRRSRMTRLSSGSISDGTPQEELSLDQYERQCTNARVSITSAQLKRSTTSVHDQGTCSARWCCQQVVVSTYFEWLVAAIILSNAVFVGVQADWGVHHPGEELPLGYHVLDNSLLVFFTLELILRIVAEGCTFLSRQNPEVRWNVFDSALIAISYWELVTTALGVSFIKTNVTRLLRLSRLVRAMRVVRIIRFFSDLRVMVLAIGSSLKLLLWASCLLLMIMFLFAVSFVQIVEIELASKVEDASGVTMHGDDDLRAYWGSLSRALYTLYMSISNGISWDAAAEPLLMISPFLAGAYCLYIGISLFCVLNTITGIFCEKAIQIASADEDCMMWNELDRRKRWVRDVKRIFLSSDGGRTGRLDWPGFCSLLDDLQMQNILKSLGVDVTAVEPRMLFDLFDTDGGGTIEINEFAAALQKLHGSAKAVDMARMRYKLSGMSNRIKEIKAMLESQGLAPPSPKRARADALRETDFTESYSWETAPL